MAFQPHPQCCLCAENDMLSWACSNFFLLLQEATVHKEEISLNEGN